MAQLIPRHGKSFADRHNQILHNCGSKRNMHWKVSLVVAWRIYYTAANIEPQFSDKKRYFEWFYLYLDRSTDV